MMDLSALQHIKSANNSPHGMESITILDSSFHSGDSGFQVLDSGFWILCQWKLLNCILDSSGWWDPDSLSCVPDSKAQDSGFHEITFLDSGLHEQNCSGFRNTDSLTWATQWNEAWVENFVQSVYCHPKP